MTPEANKHIELPRRQRRVIGIVGGMGPWAHMDFERKLLEGAKERFDAKHDQQFPEWLLSSMPATPDRTRALRGQGADPMPWLLRSTKRVWGPNRADFVVYCCHTAHAFLNHIRAELEVPILDMVEETCRVLAEDYDITRVGVLGTTGLLGAGLYQDLLEHHDLEGVSLLDIPNDGDRLQHILVMESIYGDPSRGVDDGGIKGGKKALERAKRRLSIASKTLVEQMEVEVILSACTEIPLALEGDTIYGVPLVDPTQILASAALDVAYGHRAVPTPVRHAS
ncbi:MAG: amino acid racemase [Myxococcota bacterium]